MAHPRRALERNRESGGNDISGSFSARPFSDLLPRLLDRMSSLEIHQEIQQHAEHRTGHDGQLGDVLTEYEGHGAGNDKDDDWRD
jgi:hypothetical protein